ncbi:hypothetical protein [Saccharopolyspora endophytica]|uniref:Integral membrane protein n=1 Tax=Saccharopolyspora endophytica TaxID=543886 RepID=A0ABS5DCR3_9PSEU|nr:hypothetical protein [Saccharopolyspora endophytica]MBQ0924100.1 hypothetical protein [Saccharopolyspora endophytica]
MSAAQPAHGHHSQPEPIPTADRIHTAKGIAGTALLPWRAARFLLKPRVGPFRQDRTLDQLAFWRSAIGLAVIILAAHPWRTAGAVLESTTEKTLVTAGYAMLAVPLPFLALLIATRHGHRTELLRGVPRLLGRAALALIGPLGFFGMLFAFDGYDGRTPTGPDFLSIAGIVLTMTWLIILSACAVYWAARTGFWLSEVHPLLAPIGTTLVMLVVTSKELVEFNTEGTPVAVWLTLNLGGAATALALSTYEYRHLRSIGHRFRTGPQPVATPDGPTIPVSKRSAARTGHHGS